MVNSKLIVNADDFANSVDVINGITMEIYFQNV